MPISSNQPAYRAGLCRPLRRSLASAVSLLLALLLTACNLTSGGAFEGGDQHANSAPTPVANPAVAPRVTQLPVFPGATGFGTRTPAGRGGALIAVTSLADSGPGTLREALNRSGPRIIVFRVGGVIVLKDKLFIHNPYVTVAGQTAPGDGITLRDFGLVILTHDVLVQHLRVRPGNQGDIDAEANDAIEVLGDKGNRGAKGAYNIVLDHISASWAEDEVISTWFGAHDITISWSVISEGLNRSRHSKGEHSSGLVIGGYSERVSLHHNLFAHNHSRNPLIKFGGTHELVGNIVYDWKMLATNVIDDEPTDVNIVNNHFRVGPATKLVQEIVIENQGSATPRLYVAGNTGPNISEPASNPWGGVFLNFSKTPAPTKYRHAQPFATPAASDRSAATDYAAVLDDVGASLPRRDAIDQRIVEDVRRLRGKIIDSPSEVGGYPAYRGGTSPPDADDDGMPDAWETAHDLNPRDPGDGNGDRNGDGYTNIEEYLYSLRP